MQSLLIRFLRNGRLTSVFAVLVALVVSYALGAFSGPIGETSYAGNTLLTISMITKEALRILENNLAFTKRVNRQLTFESGCPCW